MRKTLFLPLLVLLLWQVPSYADSTQDAEFHRGFEAYHFSNYSKAFEIWKPLAESGHAIAQYYLGELYKWGWGVAEDYSEAKKWYRKAFKSLKRSAEKGDVLAQYWRGRLYDFGNGRRTDYKKAKKWYRKAFKSLKPLADSGHGPAQYLVGWLYYYGRGVAEDKSEAFKWWLKAAKQGHAIAQDQVAWMYKEGKGVSKSLVDAYMWYSALQKSEFGGEYATDKLKSIEEQLSPEQLQQLIEQGNAWAQYILGKIYEEGIGVPQSLFDAYIWYTVAKLNGHDDSEKRAQAIEEKLIPAEIQQAKAKAKQCIESNYKNCSWKTASDSNKDDKFKRGIETYDAKDYRKAFQIWKALAESGHVKSQYYLGIMYYEGKGTIRNYKKAHLWYYNAAKQGHAGAQNKLGTMYSEGKGVPQDSINAYMWHSVAVANGGDSSSLDYLERILSPQQLDQALAKSEQCFNSNYKNCD